MDHALAIVAPEEAARRAREAQIGFDPWHADYPRIEAERNHVQRQIDRLDASRDRLERFIPVQGDADLADVAWQADAPWLSFEQAMELRRDLHNTLTDARLLTGRLMGYHGITPNAAPEVYEARSHRPGFKDQLETARGIVAALHWPKRALDDYFNFRMGTAWRHSRDARVDEHNALVFPRGYERLRATASVVSGTNRREPPGVAPRPGGVDLLPPHPAWDPVAPNARRLPDRELLTRVREFTGEGVDTLAARMLAGAGAALALAGGAAPPPSAALLHAQPQAPEPSGSSALGQAPPTGGPSLAPYASSTLGTVALEGGVPPGTDPNFHAVPRPGPPGRVQGAGLCLVGAGAPPAAAPAQLEGGARGRPGAKRPQGNRLLLGDELRAWRDSSLRREAAHVAEEEREATEAEFVHYANAQLRAWAHGAPAPIPPRNPDDWAAVMEDPAHHPGARERAYEDMIGLTPIRHERALAAAARIFRDNIADELEHRNVERMLPFRAHGPLPPHAPREARVGDAPRIIPGFDDMMFQRLILPYLDEPQTDPGGRNAREMARQTREMARAERAAIVARAAAPSPPPPPPPAPVSGSGLTGGVRKRSDHWTPDDSTSMIAGVARRARFYLERDRAGVEPPSGFDSAELEAEAENAEEEVHERLLHIGAVLRGLPPRHGRAGIPDDHLVSQFVREYGLLDDTTGSPETPLERVERLAQEGRRFAPALGEPPRRARAPTPPPGWNAGPRRPPQPPPPPPPAAPPPAAGSGLAGGSDATAAAAAAGGGTRAQEGIALSDTDIAGLVPGVKIMTYPQLHAAKSLHDIVPRDGAVVILFLTQSKRSGHWTAVLHHSARGPRAEHWEYFDSYGGRPDAPLRWISPAKRADLDETNAQLSRLLAASPLPVVFNNAKLQERDDDVATCGRHVVVRLWHRAQSLPEYVTALRAGGRSPDAVVTAATAGPLAALHARRVSGRKRPRGIEAAGAGWRNNVKTTRVENQGAGWVIEIELRNHTARAYIIRVNETTGKRRHSKPFPSSVELELCPGGTWDPDEETGARDPPRVIASAPGVPLLLLTRYVNVWDRSMFGAKGLARSALAELLWFLLDEEPDLVHAELCLDASGALRADDVAGGVPSPALEARLVKLYAAQLDVRPAFPADLWRDVPAWHVPMRGTVADTFDRVRNHAPSQRDATPPVGFDDEREHPPPPPALGTGRGCARVGGIHTPPSSPPPPPPGRSSVAIQAELASRRTVLAAAITAWVAARRAGRPQAHVDGLLAEIQRLRDAMEPLYAELAAAHAVGAGRAGRGGPRRGGRVPVQRPPDGPAHPMTPLDQALAAQAEALAAFEAWEAQAPPGIADGTAAATPEVQAWVEHLAELGQALGAATDAVEAATAAQQAQQQPPPDINLGDQ